MKIKTERILEFPEDGVGLNCDYSFPYFHNHDYWEFMYTLRTITNNSPTNSSTIPPHSILIIKPSDCHAISLPEPPKDASPSYLNLKINKETLKTLLAPFDDSLYATMKKTDFSPLPFTKKHPLFNLLIDSFFQMDIPIVKNHIPSLIKSAIVSIIFYYIQLFPLPQHSLTHIPDSIKELALRLSSPNNFNTKLSDLCSDLPYSTMQLTRLFKKYFSTTMIDYFLNSKLHYAQNELAYSDNSVLDIAMNIGLSLSRFDSLFKEKFGIAPIQFRKKANSPPPTHTERK